MHLGILFHFDPSVKIINTEIGFLNKLIGLLNPTEITFIKCLGNIDGILRRANLDFNYKVTSDHLIECDYLITWNSTNLSNFFGGMASDNFVKYYEALSKHSVNKPILFRAGDSENEIHDYRDLVIKRAENPNFADKNTDAIERLSKIPSINLSNLYILANGEPDRFDWVTDSYTERLKNKLPESVCKQALYLGDDLFFQVLEHKNKYQLTSIPESNSLFWIGFIDGGNSKRYKIFQSLFPAANVPFTLQSNKPVEGLVGVECVEESIEGDTFEYFSHLSNYLGYIFIGKGNPTCTYVNKTVYDCFIAGIPALIYKGTDSQEMVFDIVKDSYFSTPKELEELYQKISDPIFRRDLVERQAQEIYKRLEKQTNLGKDQIKLLLNRYQVKEQKTTKSLLEF